MSLFEDLDAASSTTIVHAPFNWAGGKGRSVKQIIPLLPVKKIYVEPFGGSGAILLNRQPSKCEVFNDRHSGVTAFYKCIRDKSMLDALITRLELTIHSREDWVECKSTWETTSDPVERAAKWYYMIAYSFGGLGRNFGRNMTGGMAGKIRRALPEFDAIHRRMCNVQVENQDWLDICRAYDSEDTVIYLDPPYVDTYNGMGYDSLTIDRHKELIKFAQECKSFVAISGYSNPLYDSHSWDDVREWSVYCSLRSEAYTETNGKAGLKNTDTERGNAKEKLWLKVNNT